MSAVDVRRAEALFVSGLDPAEHPTGEQVRRAVEVELVVGDCPARMAQEFGDHPDTACRRMRWCRAAVRLAFAPASV
ncbi:MAG: hypothetical protein ABW022_03235 [Actinoplanes sp.]